MGIMQIDEQLDAAVKAWEKDSREAVADTATLVGQMSERYATFIGVYGSARTADQAPVLHEVCGDIGTEIGIAIAECGYSLLSGGCPGMVELAQKRFVENRSHPAQLSLGVRIENLSFKEDPNPYLDLAIFAPDFGSRLRLLVDLPRAYFIMPGGFGSFLEIAFPLQHTQAVKTHKGRPIYLVGECWTPMLQLVENMVHLGTINPDDARLIRLITNVTDMPTVIRGLKLGDQSQAA